MPHTSLPDARFCTNPNHPCSPHPTCMLSPPALEKLSPPPGRFLLSRPWLRVRFGIQEGDLLIPSGLQFHRTREGHLWGTNYWAFTGTRWTLFLGTPLQQAFPLFRVRAIALRDSVTVNSIARLHHIHQDELGGYTRENTSSL